MTPAARVQAAIELLDQIIAAAREEGPAADRIIAEWFRQRRYAGSGDRRAARDLVYRAIRACGPVPESGRAAMLRLAETDASLRTLFDGSRHAPSPIVPEEQPAAGGIAPAWLEEALSKSGIAGDEAAALLDRAPLDIRINALKAGRLTLPEDGVRTVAPHALRFPLGTPVEQWDAYRSGAIEVQDTASQLVCEVVGARPGEAIIDLCAGAGGKTLALAAAMEDAGTLLACDVDRARLSRLAPRAERAGAHRIETRLLDPMRETESIAEWLGKADAVLVDAPCSGTGTWRRNPEARWRLTGHRLDAYRATQARLLRLAASLVRPGGRLVYAVCSVLDQEGADQASSFLADMGQWRVDGLVLPAGHTRGHGIRFTPFCDETDGFFVARFNLA